MSHLKDGEIAVGSRKIRQNHCIAYCIIVNDRSQCLLSQFRHSECTILLGTTWSQGCKARHEEVQAWEGHQVYSNLTQVTIQLSRETETASDTAHRCRDQMIQITIGWCSQFQGTETNIVQSFIVQQEGLIWILHQLMEAQDSLERCNLKRKLRVQGSNKQYAVHNMCGCLEGRSQVRCSTSWALLVLVTCGKQVLYKCLSKVRYSFVLGLNNSYCYVKSLQSWLQQNKTTYHNI